MAGNIYHEWNGTVLTITSDSGVSSCDLKGDKGDDGCRGPQGIAGSTYAEDSKALGGVSAENYALKEEIPDLEPYAEKAQLEDYALKTELPDLEPYATKELAHNKVAYNLLDNSNFRIAQAGYGGYHGEIKYACDRWKDAYGYGEFSYDENYGLRMAYGKNDAYLLQMLEHPELLAGKVCSLAVKEHGEPVVVLSGTMTGDESIVATYGVTAFAIRLCGNRVYLVLNSGYKYIEWIALYEGEYTAETLPKYIPKGYAAELAECQRYYEKLGVHFLDRGKDVLYYTINYKPKYRYPTLEFSKDASDNVTENIGLWSVKYDSAGGIIGTVPVPTGQAHWYGYVEIYADIV